MFIESCGTKLGPPVARHAIEESVRQSRQCMSKILFKAAKQNTHAKSDCKRRHPLGYQNQPMTPQDYPNTPNPTKRCAYSTLNAYSYIIPTTPIASDPSSQYIH
jgi:hypothetical protein